MHHARTRPLLAAVAVTAVAVSGLVTGVAAAPSAGAAPATIRVITHNLEKNPAALEAVVTKINLTTGPEVVMLQEVCESLLPRIRGLGYSKFRARKAHAKCGGENIGEAVVWTGGNRTDKNAVTLVRDSGHRYGLACVTFAYAGRATRACSTHLAAGQEFDEVRQRITRGIRAKSNTWIAEGKRVIVGGDFNSNPKDAAMASMYGVGGGAQGPFRELAQMAEGGSTLRQGLATKGGRKIDYIFVSMRDTRTSSGTEKTCGEECTPSDHRMLWGTAPLKPRG